MPTVPAIEGWFTTGEAPALIGARCTSCGTSFFPRAEFCRNPHCGSDRLEDVELSRRGTIWSWTVNHFSAPPPFPQSDDFQPYGVAAVELAEERIVVLGQIASGVSPDDLKVGGEAELVVEPLYTEGDTTHLVWKWKPV